jgi:dTMP kinase
MTPGPAPAGFFITFEGVEGSGKSTQIVRLAVRLAAAGIPYTLTREPGGTGLGRLLRAILLEERGAPIHPTTELLLYAADRAQHLTETVEPALARGEVVLCDRYLDATLAYQGYGRGLGVEAVLALHQAPPLDRRPDRTLLLDLEPDEGLARARDRNQTAARSRDEGRYEAEALEFHHRVRSGYRELAAAEPVRWRVVDARGDEGVVEERVAAALADLLPLQPGVRSR